MGKRAFNADLIQRITAQQGHICVYCTLPFGAVVSYKGETVQTPVGDHFIPYSWTAETNDDNLVVCCQVCNGIKFDHLFESVEHARRSILVRRMEKRILTFFIPEHPMTEDPEAWSRDYQRFCSDL